MRKFLLFDKIRFICVIIIKVLASLLWVGFALVIQDIVNSAIEIKSLDEFKSLVLRSAIFCLLVFLTYFINQICTQFYQNKCIKLFRMKYFDNLIHFDSEDFSKKDSAEYLSALTNDVNIIETKYFTSIFLLVEDLTSIISTFFVIYFMNQLIALLMLGMTLLLAIVPGLLKKPIDKMNEKYSNRLTKYTGVLKETFLGFDVIKSFAAEKVFMQKVHQSNNEVYKTYNRLNILTNITGLFSYCLSQAMSMILMVVSAGMAIQGKLDVGAVVAILNLSIRFFQQIQNVASHIIMPLSVSSINKKLMEIAGNRIPDLKAADVTFEKALEVKNLSFQYQEQDKKYILDDINLQIRANEKCLILGTSGSGKSTLLKLINNMYHSFQGEILLDGTSYREIAPDRISRFIVMAQQKSYLFNRTLRQNIDILDSRDDERLEKIIKMTQLTDVVKNLPNGLDTLIDEEVNQLSGGEKMRVNLARALYQNAPVLLLDEITSALDRVNSEKIEKMILSLSDKTVLNVCHKFNSNYLDLYDKIIIIEDGRIVESGTYKTMKHSDLLMKYQEPSYSMV